MSLRKKQLLLSFLLLFSILAGLTLGVSQKKQLTPDQQLEDVATSVFCQEVTGTTLTLHYTLANPAAYQISPPPPTLGSISTDASKAQSLCHTYEQTLLSIPPEELSIDNQITRDTLLLYFQSQQLLLEQPLFFEPLSPSLGIQAQLPVLLAEYVFNTKYDILDYLALLKQIHPYFESILSFEREKAKAGCFMSDVTLDRILSQCNSFLSDPEDNYMLALFTEKLHSLSFLTPREISKLIAYHRTLLLDEVLPAYQMLSDSLNELRGSGKDSCGLSCFPGGQKYYETLIASETGVYDSVPNIEQRLLRQMKEDSHQIHLILREQPSLADQLKDPSLFPSMEPEEILTTLSKEICEDFPPPADVTAEIRTVHPSMENYLSPAFYLTPPLDTCRPNVIYLNSGSHAQGLELFTTLAHEGFPGHLYQTVSFGSTNTHPVRHLITCDGYIEGWATYVEQWAAHKASSFIDNPAASDLVHLYTLNRSFNLCIYSLMDLGIHYHSWTPKLAARFLSSFGIYDESIVQKIYQYIVETPGNYLNYYLGSLKFQDLLSAQRQKKGKDFSLKDFHQKVLSIGPVPFPVLEKYIDCI